MNLNTTNNFNDIILNEIPLIDVRAPIEFEKGAFLHAVNIPIMDDKQRHEIGIKYKKQGNEEAVKLGYDLVSGDDKDMKISRWKEFYLENPSTIIYCFRGGQRSRISQEWIQEALGRDILRIEGGFKAFRNHLINAYQPDSFKFNPIRLGGNTGSGKTPLLLSLDHSVDLEGIANHRGSSFGSYITPQPSQIDFENNLAYKLIQQQHKGYKNLIFEDEGRHVGRCFLPKVFSDFTAQSDLVLVKVSLEQRGLNILREYVTDSQKSYLDFYGVDLGYQLWLDYIIASIDKAKRRLGGDRHKAMVDSVTSAFNHQLQSGDASQHLDWINLFLTDYYDPMYDYQIEQNDNHIIYEGNTREVIEYLNSLK